MELRLLKTFVAIVRCGSFGAAALELGYAQSTITGQIQTLETELGTTLFERLGRQNRLTVAGEALYERAEKLLLLAAETVNAVSADAKPKGILRIGVPESLCIHALPPLLKDYQAACPDVDIRLRFDNCRHFLSWLHSGDLDVALLLDEPLAAADLTIHPLFDEPMALLAAPGQPLTVLSKVGPQDLNGQPLLLTEKGCSYRRMFDEMLTAHAVQPRSILEIDSVEVLRHFALNGLGLTFLSRQLVNDDLNAGRLIALPWIGSDFPVRAQLVHHRDKWLSPALRAFIALLKSRLTSAAFQ